MIKLLSLLFLLGFSSSLLASHITGGEMTYTYLGPGSAPKSKKYNIILKLFRDSHTTGAAMPNEVYIGIFDNDSDVQFPGANKPFVVNKMSENAVPVNGFPPCLNNAPDLDYTVGSYSLTIELPDKEEGYTATYQTCCRVNPLENVFNADGNGGTGGTYSCLIPPLEDSSPAFAATVDLLCQGRDFTLNFSATDDDADELVYSFVPAYDGGAARNANNINPASPGYRSVSYINGYTATTPLGSLVTLNSKTGIISGIAPGLGQYVVCVAVKSYRDGKYIGEHRKDLIVTIGDCDFAGAQLNPKPVSCDGFSVAFRNDNNSSLNKTFLWDFGDPNSGALNTSTEATPTHVFSDTGVFVYKLIVNNGDPCSDEKTQTIKVYPGFNPGFTTAGRCKTSPIRFSDTSKTRYGSIDTWHWDFDDPSAIDDTSNIKAPSYIYSQSGDYNVTFSVTNSKGCVGVVTKTVTVNDQPDFAIPNDTLICSVDTLRLQGSGDGIFSWSPVYNINDVGSATPLVSPDVPTTYIASFSDAYGCKGTDSVLVDVVSKVSLSTGKDTIICAGDQTPISINSNALSYSWTPVESLNNTTDKSPIASPFATTTYNVVGTIGKCQATDDITIKAAPYPQASAGIDSILCIGETIQLNASGGSIYTWSPALYLNNQSIANPFAKPASTITYVVTVGDVLGCPKTVSDSVTVSVLNIVADAGPRDTSVVIGQPLQLSGTGGTTYLWTPTTGLSNFNIANPTALISDNQQYILKVQEATCTDTDTINIVVYKVDAGLYVPNAFTPNRNGLNDLFRPIPLGIKSITNFKVFSRWGQLVYASKLTGETLGWDGTFKGKPQDSGTYVWIAEAVDYLDRKIVRKGSVMLIR
ncbi:MAG: PKD domain-containing protein [Ginsengibacter sp.]